MLLLHQLHTMTTFLLKKIHRTILSSDFCNFFSENTITSMTDQIATWRGVSCAAQPQRRAGRAVAAKPRRLSRGAASSNGAAVVDLPPSSQNGVHITDTVHGTAWPVLLDIVKDNLGCLLLHSPGQTCVPAQEHAVT